MRGDHPSHLLVSSADAIDRPAVAPNLRSGTQLALSAPAAGSGSRTVPVGGAPDWHPTKRGKRFMQEPLFWAGEGTRGAHLQGDDGEPSRPRRGGADPSWRRPLQQDQARHSCVALRCAWPWTMQVMAGLGPDAVSPEHHPRRRAAALGRGLRSTTNAATTSRRPRDLFCTASQGHGYSGARRICSFQLRPRLESLLGAQPSLATSVLSWDLRARCSRRKEHAKPPSRPFDSSGGARERGVRERGVSRVR